MLGGKSHATMSFKETNLKQKPATTLIDFSTNKKTSFFQQKFDLKNLSFYLNQSLSLLLSSCIFSTTFIM